MIDDIIETILDQADENLIHEAGRDAGEAIAKVMERGLEERLIDRAVEFITRGRGKAANAFACGIASGLRDSLIRPEHD